MLSLFLLPNTVNSLDVMDGMWYCPCGAGSGWVGSVQLQAGETHEQVQREAGGCRAVREQHTVVRHRVGQSLRWVSGEGGGWD